MLTGIYKRIEAELADGRRPRELKKLPLWTGKEWRRGRPTYAVAQEGLAQSLGRELPVWAAPCALAALPRFIEAANVTVLDAQRFQAQGIGPGHRAAGSRLRPHFLAAVRYFAELLSKHLPDVHTSPAVTFDDLEEYELAHSAKLEVLVPLAHNQVRAAGVNVFASSGLRLIAFRDPDALGRHELGGMAIGALFGEAWTTALAALWEIAWQRADPENLREKVRIAREEPAAEDPLKKFMESAAGRKAAKALVRGAPDSPDKTPTGQNEPARRRPESKPRPRRRLRDLSKVTFGEPRITGEDTAGTRKHRRRRQLKDPPPQITGTPPPPAKEPPSIREYDEKEKETEGFKLLAKALSPERAVAAA